MVTRLESCITHEPNASEPQIAYRETTALTVLRALAVLFNYGRQIVER